MRVSVSVAAEGLRECVCETVAQLGVVVDAPGAVQICDSVAAIIPGTPAVLLWQREGAPEDLPFEYRDLRHLVSATPELDAEALLTTLAQVIGGGALALDDLLDEPYMSEKSETRSSRQKGVLLARFASFLQATDSPQNQRDDLLTHLEELLSNAIYNAPVEDGRRINAALHRAEAASSGRPVTIAWAFDRTRTCVAVRDEYGSLDPSAVIDALFRCYRGARVEVQEKEGGAGLGLFTLMRLSSRLVVNIDPGRSTEVIALRRLTDRRRPWPTLNICVHSP